MSGFGTVLWRLWEGLTASRPSEAPAAPSMPSMALPSPPVLPAVAPPLSGVPVSAPGEFPIPQMDKPDAVKPEAVKPVAAAKPAVAVVIRPKFITPEDFARVARLLNVPLEWVVAADRVETGGLGGFSKRTGLSRKLFEARWFHNFTGGRFDATNPKLSSPFWDRTLYLGGDAEEGRVNAARALDTTAANKSYSSGRFQIMGFNFAACGWKDLAQWTADMEASEGNHLDAWAGFLKSKGLDKALREKDADAYAFGYNGAGYRENGYATKLRSLVAQIEGVPDTTQIGQQGMVRIGMKGGNVVLLQVALNRQGYNLVTDGDFGAATQVALITFQAKNGLQQDGVAGPATMKALDVKTQ